MGKHEEKKKTYRRKETIGLNEENSTHIVSAKLGKFLLLIILNFFHFSAIYMAKVLQFNKLTPTPLGLAHFPLEILKPSLYRLVDIICSEATSVTTCATCDKPFLTHKFLTHSNVKQLLQHLICFSLINQRSCFFSLLG